MPKLTITLDEDAALKLRRLVGTGRHGDESQVILEALTSLEEGDADIEDWLRDVVVPAYDAWMADPGRELSIEEVRRQLLQDHEAETER